MNSRPMSTFFSQFLFQLFSLPFFPCQSWISMVIQAHFSGMFRALFSKFTARDPEY